MSSGDYTQQFTAWSGYATNWNGLGVLGTGSVPAATKTTTATTTLGTIGASTAIGYDAASSTKLVFLTTGSTDNTTAVAADLNLDFTGRNAGTLGFDYALIFNTSGSAGRAASLIVYASADGGTTWTTLTGPYTVYNTTGNSTAAVSISAISLPSSFNNAATCKLRFYGYNGGTPIGTPSGNRPKISLDNVAVTSTASGPSAPAITTPTSANINSSAADLGGNVTSDGGSAITERGVVWSATATNNDPLIGGTGVTKVTGTGTTGVFTVNATSLPFATGISFKAYATNSVGTSYTSVSTFNTLGATPPTLTAASGATVDASFDVIFADNSSWTGAITAVKYGANTLVLNTDYTISAGKITLIPSGSSSSGLRTPGSQTVTVVATGYTDATVTQSISAGAANKLAISIQPSGPSSNGGSLVTQPVILIQDQYGNATTSTANVTAAVGAGTWTLGGTTTVAAVSGTTTFSGLTATCANTVTGATISFNSPGLTGISSNTFKIVGPIIAQWSFEGVTTTNTGSTIIVSGGSAVADIGLQTTGSSFTAVHASSSTVWSNPAGNGSKKSISSTFWAPNDYYQFSLSTAGYSGIKLSWDHFSSGTGPRDFKVQYSTDGSSFTDVSGGSYAIPSTGSWSSTSYLSASNNTLDLSGLSALNNNSTVYLRLICTSTSSVGGATIATGGTSRIDSFTVTGCAIPTVSSQPGTSQSVCKDATPANITVTGAGFGLSYQWYSNSSNSNSGGTDLGSGSGAQTATYTPPTSTAGTLYYYCVITGTCGSVVSNTSEVIVNDIATANAGSNQGVCGPTTATLNGSIGGSATSATWSSDGAGTFSPNANTLNATYNATTAELRAGASITFTLTPNNPAGCGISTSITHVAFCANASLPVSFTSFSGKKMGSQNLLKWTTANEQNNTGFEVMRSSDGIHYSGIGFVGTLAINGNSNDLLNYSFVDNLPSGDRQYYQLKQIDLDGRSKTSSVVLIRESNSGSFTIDQLMPNPARDKVNAIVLSPGKDKLHLMITDLSGKTIRQQYNFVEAGSNTIEMQTGGLASGTYLVQVISITTGQRSFSKLIKQ